MKRTTLTKLVVALAIIVQSVTVFASDTDNERPVSLKEKKLNGPRLGVTYVFHDNDLAGTGKFAEKLKENNIGYLISQFGWQFEWLVAPKSGGPAFVTEVMPFIGGVEHGKIIPSASVIAGIRMPFGLEFGMGPNVSITFSEKQPVNTSLVLAVGQNLDFGGVNIPLNVAVSTNRDGNRLAFVFGYAIADRQ